MVSFRLFDVIYAVAGVGLVLGTLYLTFVYAWPRFIVTVAHTEIVEIVKQTVKEECLR